MLRGKRLYVFAVGFIAVCLSAANAHENDRVRLNDTILECRPPYGCFVVETYVVERQSKAEQEYDDNGTEVDEDWSGKENDGQINIWNLSIEPVDGNTDRTSNDGDCAECKVGPWGLSLENLLLFTGPLAAWVAAWLVWLTYQQTMESLRVTRQELQATREIQEAQVRAYITASGGSFRIFREQNEITFNIEFYNAGNSPARNIVFFPQIIIILHGGEEGRDIVRTRFERLRITEIFARETRGRDGIIFIGARYIHLAQAVRDGTASVKIGGVVRFEDDFGKRRKAKVAIAGFVEERPVHEEFFVGNLKPVNVDLWSKKQLDQTRNRRG